MLFQKQTPFLLVLTLSALACLQVFATDQVVSDPGDSGGANQLRAKLTAAENSGGGTITFTTGPATIVLNSSLPEISANTTIDGSNVVTISGNNACQILYVEASTTLNLRNLTLTHAYNDFDGGAMENDGTLNIYNCKFLSNQTDPGYSGGAILAYGPLNITNTEFGANSGGNGGAIYPRYAAAVTTIVGCDFHDNTAVNTSSSGWGGAILLWDGAPVNLIRDTFETNNAYDGGGALFVQGSSVLTVSGSQFTGNYTTFAVASGGAIYSQGVLTISGTSFVNNYTSSGGALNLESGVAILSRDAFLHNWADYGGGVDLFGPAILNASDCYFSGNGYGAAHEQFCLYGGGIISESGGELRLNRVTLSSNYAENGGGLDFFGSTNTLQNVTISGNQAQTGAGIDATYGLASLTNVTICQNTATNGAGGISRYMTSQTPMTVKNVLLAANMGGNSDTSFGTGTFSLSDDGTCGLGAGHDNVANILLGPLASNGGAAPTHLPQNGSAAIDAATSIGAPLLDQRGYLRAGAAPDIGAVESGGQPTQITSITRVDPTHVVLKGKGLANFNLNLEAAADPESLDFNTLGGATSDASGLWQYTDTSAASLANRYYRATFLY